jgi:hypothetical protein
MANILRDMYAPISTTCQPMMEPAIDGDTRLNNFDPSYIANWYYSTGLMHQRTPLTDNFFSVENVKYIVDQIEKALFTLTNGQKVRIPINDELAQTMWDAASQNVGLSYYPGAVAMLNRYVVEHEARVQYYSLLRRKLWIKYFLTQDRKRVQEYGEYTRNTKGEVTISSSGYMLSDPWKRYRNCYLRDTEGLVPDENGQYATGRSTSGLDGPRFAPIPNYLLPKVPPVTRPAYQLGTTPRSPKDCYRDQLTAQFEAGDADTSFGRVNAVGPNQCTDAGNYVAVGEVMATLDAGANECQFCPTE